jgi:5-methylcytosine-specific restriction protein A
MSWGFERGRTYNRRKDIHGRYAGQQQGGIITPSAFSVIFIITGEEGLAHGYADRLLPDGTFEYFGEGQLGDMKLERGNAAIANHIADGRDLLLFRKTAAGLRFEGPMVCSGHHFEPAPDREGNMRQAIVFELFSLDGIEEAAAEVEPDISPDLAALRAAALAASKADPKRRSTKTTVTDRSRAIRDYVVARANGHCEGCRVSAPFKRPNGVPYLEPHHIRRLTDGGPDDPHFVIALCPNCHRRVHSGADGRTYNDGLLSSMKVIEPN